MLALLPFVVLGSLACNRRAATAAFVIILPVLVLAAYQALPNRRRLIGLLSAAGVLAFAGYLCGVQKQQQHFGPAGPRDQLPVSRRTRAMRRPMPTGTPKTPT